MYDNGFQEVIYQRALEIEMRNQKIEFCREHEMEYFTKEIILEPIKRVMKPKKKCSPSTNQTNYSSDNERRNSNKNI